MTTYIICIGFVLVIGAIGVFFDKEDGFYKGIGVGVVIYIILSNTIDFNTKPNNFIERFVFKVAGCSISIGSAEVTFYDHTIFISDFPPYSVGLTGFNQVSFRDDFSFEELDEFVYKIVTEKSDHGIINIVIQMTSQDRYGYSYQNDPVTIGSININESKRYKDFFHWKQNYSTKKMFYDTYDLNHFH